MKTKQITKQKQSSSKNSDRKQQKQKKAVTNQKGDPIIEHLNDFVTAIKNTYTSRPIYTGGRILIMDRNIYATCNHKICVYNYQRPSLNQQGNGSIQEQDKDRYQYISHKNEQIVNFCVCPHQKYIVTFTKNSLLRVMQIETKKVMHIIKMGGAFANDIAFSPDGKHLACAFGNQVQIFTFQSMKRTHSYYPSGNNNKFVITKLKWHPNPQLLQLITTDMQHTLTIFDYILNKIVASSETNQGGSDFCLSEDGKIIFSIKDLEIRVFQLRALKLKYRIPIQNYLQCVFAIGNHLYFGGQQTELLSIDYHNFTQKSAIKQHKGCTDNGISKIMGFTQAGQKKLFVLSHQQNISLLKIPHNNHLQFEGMIVGYNDQIIDIKCSKNIDNQKYFILVTNSNNVKVMNSKTHKLEFLIKGHSNTVLCAQYYYPYIATGGKDNQMKLWQINQEKKGVYLLGNYHGHSGDILSICLLPNKHQLATISDDHTLKVWPMIQPSIEDIQSTSNAIQIRSSLHTVPAHAKSINGLRVCPKEEYLATCSQDKSIKIWSIELNSVMTLVGHRKGVWDISFHPIQKLLISVGGEGMIKGWSLITGQNLWSMGEGPPLLRCYWIYYNQVVTGSLDGIVKIWDIRKMTSLTYDKHEGKIWAIDIQKNKGKARIYTGGTDSIYHVWDDNTEQVRQDIMHKGQLEQKQKIFYSQCMAQKNYVEAALIAFQGGYNKLFINVIEKIATPFSACLPITFSEDQKLIVNEQQQEDQQIAVSEDQFKTLVRQLKKKDISRLLIILRAMNSTIRHYKIANKMLNQLLKMITVDQFMQLNKSFIGEINEQNEDMFAQSVQKKSAFQKWLQQMLGFQGKHSTRIQKYIRGTYWIEHLHKIENPFLN